MDPVCFHIGERPVYWYGVMMAVAFLAGIAHWNWLGRRTGRDASLAGDLAFWLMGGGILGARVAYVLANYRYYLDAPQEIIRIDQGGLIYYGGFIGGTLAFMVFARRRRLPLLELGDFTVTALPLGHAFGRIGCFLNGCCGGIPAPDRPLIACGLDHYPVQLYEALFNFALYAFLSWRLATTRTLTRGRIVALYLIAYPLERFLIEFLRGDARLRFGALNAAQELSLILLAIGLGLWWTLTSHENKPRHS